MDFFSEPALPLHCRKLATSGDAGDKWLDLLELLILHVARGTHPQNTNMRARRALSHRKDVTKDVTVTSRQLSC
jgi:hypothetical protein